MVIRGLIIHVLVVCGLLLVGLNFEGSFGVF